MSSMSRLALGAIQPEADPTAVIWALLAVLRQTGRQAQVFHDQAHFSADTMSQAICGQSPRYLDSWLMTADLCRESFSFGMDGCDIGLVVGKFDQMLGPATQRRSSLDPLCDWLDVPRVAIVDVSQWDRCDPPPSPQGASAVLFDRVPRGQFFEMQTVYESLYRVPVLGGLPRLKSLRARAAVAIQSGCAPCGICEEFGGHLAANLRTQKLYDIAARGFVPPAPHVFSPGHKLQGLHVAVAYDEAFDSYFSEVLDLMELQGAAVSIFSPLRDPALPEAADVVYLGGGHPEQFAQQLSGNQCLALALREHVRRGRRVYAEGAGCALLAQQMRLNDQRQVPMFGVIPAVAVLNAPACRNRAARSDEGSSKEAAAEEVMLTRDHWLGEAGTSLRGYRDDAWRLESPTSMSPLGSTRNSEPRLLAWEQVVASQLHINFAAQPDFLRRFSTSGAAVL